MTAWPVILARRPAPRGYGNKQGGRRVQIAQLRSATFRLLVTLAVGLAGGAVFYGLSLPLPWLLGALSATAVASFAGLDLGVPAAVRGLAIGLLGVMLGGTFGPEVIETARQWAATLIAMAAYLLLMAAIGTWFCRRFMGDDPVTAVFSGLPGGLSELTVIGPELGADARALAISHSVRLGVVLLLVPLVIEIGFGAELGGLTPARQIADAGALALLLVGAVLGAWAARRLHLPAAVLTGPLLVGMALYMSGTVTGGFPQPVGWGIQWVIGAALGARFVGLSLRAVGRRLVRSALLSVVLLTVTGVTALTLGAVTGKDPEVLFLAFAPGGFAEMTLAALALGLDPAVVTLHHGVRIVLIVVFAPLLLRRVFRRRLESDG